MIQKFLDWISRLDKASHPNTYPIVIAVLAGLDLFILVIPTDALLISAVLIRPRRWVFIALLVALGSALGAALLGGVVQQIPTLLSESALSTIHSGDSWAKTKALFDNYGFLTLSLISISPLPQQPGVLFAGIAEMQISAIFWSVFTGRLIKYLFLAWVATHAPEFLKKFKFLRKEIETLSGQKDSSK